MKEETINLTYLEKYCKYVLEIRQKKTSYKGNKISQIYCEKKF